MGDFSAADIAGSSLIKIKMQRFQKIKLIPTIWNGDITFRLDYVHVHSTVHNIFFQEYKPAANSNPPSHKHLHHWVFLIDEAVNDYEEDNIKYGEESIGKITAK